MVSFFFKQKYVIAKLISICVWKTVKVICPKIPWGERFELSPGEIRSWMIETVECYANKDGEVIENKSKSEKFNKNLIDGENTYSTYWNDQKSVSLLELILKWRNLLTEKLAPNKFLISVIMIIKRERDLNWALGRYGVECLKQWNAMLIRIRRSLEINSKVKNSTKTLQMEKKHIQPTETTKRVTVY